MPQFLFKAHVIFLIFQNICNNSPEFFFFFLKKQELTSWQDHRKQYCESSYFETVNSPEVNILTCDVTKRYHCTLLYHLKWNKYNYVTNNYPNRWESKSCKKIQTTFCFITTQIVDIKKHWEVNLGLAKVWKMGIRTEDIHYRSYLS